MDICMDLWSGDVSISYDTFITEIRQRIENLKSHIGEEAHLKLLRLGVVDNTGMSWEKQDLQTKKEISQLEELLKFLETDSNWTP